MVPAPPSVDNFIRDTVLTEARSYIGVPYRHMGRTRHGGVDCLGLVFEVGKELGLHEYDDSISYPRSAFDRSMLEAVRKHSTSVKLADLQDGDIIIFRDTMFPQHMGFMVWHGTDRWLINANARKRKVVEEPWTKEDHERKFLAAFRFNFLAEQGT